MNIANKLTISRILMVPFFIFFYYFDDSKFTSFIIFILASFTDFLDGYVARKYDMISDFGKFLDPIADKILVLSALILFTESKVLSAVVPIIVTFREFVISGLRMLVAKNNIAVAADNIGKLKTVFQLFGIIFMFLFFCVKRDIIRNIALVLIYFSAFLTIISMFNYILKYKGVVMHDI